MAHPANLARVQRMLGTTRVARLQLARLTVVVLVTDYAPNPEATLRSVVGQQPSALDMIVVDTSLAGLGRTSAQAFVRRDGRVKYLALPGTGEEEARNRAVASSRAPYLMFLTAGDVVENRGLDIMYRSLRETGSSFAVGMTGISRASPAPRHPGSGRSTLNPGPPRPSRTCRRYCSMVPSPTSFSRRDFWISATADVALAREHWQYEAVATLYMRAKSFDILDAQVVNTSMDSAVRPPARELLCQTEYLSDRLHRLESLASVVSTVSAPEDYRRWLSGELGNGLFRYYEVVPRTDPEYWDLLHATVLRLSDGLDLDWDAIRIHNRLILSAVLTDSREDVVRICNHRSDYGSSFPTLITDSGILAQPRYLAELSGYDPDLLACRDDRSSNGQQDDSLRLAGRRPADDRRACVHLLRGPG